MGRIAGFLVLLALAGSAHAQVYLRLETGVSFSMDALIRDQNPANPAICGDPACTTAGVLGTSAGSSAVLGAGIGLHAGESWRWDLAATYRGGFDIQGSDARGTQFQTNIKSWSLMLSAFYDFPATEGGLRPYLGAGIGPARNRVEQMTAVVNSNDVTFLSGQDTSTGFHVSLGTAWRLNNGLVVDLAFRYVDLGDLKSDPGPQNSGLIGRLKTRELVAALRF